MNTMVDFPEEDSPDLTDEEITGAVEAKTPEVLVEVFAATKCLVCQGKVTTLKHQLRKRGVLHYARILFVCQDGHRGSVTFRASFLGGA